MEMEMTALARNHTWSLVDLPRGANLVTCKWIFKIKRGSDGKLLRQKARLVAHGFSQIEGIDFDETYSPVVKFPTIRVILTIAVSKGWPLHQLDVDNAFLNGELKEAVYMAQPPSFVNKNFPTKVCRLHKSLYGL